MPDRYPTAPAIQKAADTLCKALRVAESSARAEGLHALASELTQMESRTRTLPARLKELRGDRR